MICRRHNIFIVLFFCILPYSCDINNVDYYFNKLVTIKENNMEKTFPGTDIGGEDSRNNKYYRKLLSYGKSINEYLLEKAISEDETNWYNYPFYFNMKEGDIAINLLIKINDIDFYKIIPIEIMEDYKINGARIWWEYLHNNREEIINLIKENI
jgi:hypothetical protein